MPSTTVVSPRFKREDSAVCSTFGGVHGLFERAARRYPDNIAVGAANERVSYAQLNAQANKLAHHLRSQGVGPGVCVGICLDRSAKMLIGLLGVLKAGGAYVPLDPAFPQARLKYMIENSGARIIVTLTKLLSDLPEQSAQQNPMMICLDRDERSIESCDDADPAHMTDDSDLAYVIYTSGSTGQPKGVEVTHGGVVNYLTAINRVLGIDQRDAFMAVTTLSFDICAFDLFSPLSVGGKVLLIDRETASDGSRLREQLEIADPTVLQATPATWRMLIDSGWRESEARRSHGAMSISPNNRLLRAISGGEALSRELAEALLDRRVDLWNLYGPTETTIYSAYHHVLSGQGPVPIGTPLDNQSLHILDEQRKPVGVGEIGELYIGGAGVARGYRNRPELTAERFLPDAFSGVPGARIYRTGDLARQRADGLVEYLGRVDHQVKIRGFRIELGEIEANLLRQPGVRNAVVVAQSRDSGAQRLVAFIATDPSQAVSGSTLRDGLASSLPKYMIPEQYVILPALPLTLNGKIDRKALPMPTWGKSTNSQNVAPKNGLERDLAEIFAKVLQVPSVGAADNFFDLGGDSLSAVNLSIQIEKKFKRAITLAELFQAPTVGELAPVLVNDVPRSASTLMTLRPRGPKAPLFCLPGSGGSSLSFQKLVARLPDDRAVYAYNIPRLDQRPTKLNTVRDYANDVLRQIRQVCPQGPFHLLGYSFGGNVAFEIAQIMAERYEELASLGIIDSWAPGFPQQLSLAGRAMLHVKNMIRPPGVTRTRYFRNRLHNLRERTLELWRRARRAIVYRLPMHPSAKWAMEDIFETAELALHRHDLRPLYRRIDFYRVQVTPTDWPGFSFDDPYNGWRRFAAGELHLTNLPCDHDQVFEDKGIDMLVPAVIAQLESADPTPKAKTKRGEPSSRNAA